MVMTMTRGATKPTTAKALLRGLSTMSTWSFDDQVGMNLQDQTELAIGTAHSQTDNGDREETESSADRPLDVGLSSYVCKHKAWLSVGASSRCASSTGLTDREERRQERADHEEGQEVSSSLESGFGNPNGVYLRGLIYGFVGCT